MSTSPKPNVDTSPKRVLLPQVCRSETDGLLVKLTLHIPENLFYFEGHFPETPILPGIVQLHWAVEWIKSYFNVPNLSFDRVDVLKFQQVIPPNQTLELTLEKSAQKDKQFKFSYTSDAGNYSSGRIIFD